MKKLVSVRFKNSYGWGPTEYSFFTELPLVEGAIYENVKTADGSSYDNPIGVVKVSTNLKDTPNFKIKTITEVKPISVPAKPKFINNIYINEEKKTVCVLWTNGEKTIVKCQPGEEFDAEKGIALCFMKRAYKNRGCYNDVFKEYIPKAEVQIDNEVE